MRTLSSVRPQLSCLFVLAALVCASQVCAQDLRLAQLQRITVGATNGVVLRLQGVQGGSKAAGHEGWIDVLGWSFGVDANVDATRQTVTGRPQLRQLVITKPIDISTPKLFDMCTKNANVPEGELRVPISGGTLRIVMTNARIASLGQDDESGPGPATERVAFVATQYRIVVETASGNYEATWSAGRE